MRYGVGHPECSIWQPLLYLQRYGSIFRLLHSTGRLLYFIQHFGPGGIRQTQTQYILLQAPPLLESGGRADATGVDYTLRYTVRNNGGVIV